MNYNIDPQYYPLMSPFNYNTVDLKEISFYVKLRLQGVGINRVRPVVLKVGKFH